MNTKINLQEGLNSISVFDGRQFKYRFTPAEFSKGAPLLVIAGARGTAVPSKFKRNNWNVLSVVDTFGLNGDMTAYLGEGGNFFIKDLLTDLIKEAILVCACKTKENLYFYSSSIASGAAIGQGILNEARAVYLNAPIIKGHGSTIYKSQYRGYDKSLDFVIPPEMKDIIEADGVKFLKAYKDHHRPAFLLCDSLHQDEPWLHNFLEEQTLYFENACKEEGVEVYLELVDATGHVHHYTLPEVISKFEELTPPKYLDIISLKTSVENKTLSVECVLGKDYPLVGNEIFAFYLLIKGEKSQASKYSDNSKHSFELEGMGDMKDIEVKAFVKSDGEKKIQIKVNI